MNQTTRKLLAGILVGIQATVFTVQAQELQEDFAVADPLMIDTSGSSNETVQTLASTYTWGGYNAGGSDAISITGNGKLQFDAVAAAAGSYAYSRFASDFTPAHDIVIVADSVPANLEVRLLLCEYPDVGQAKRFFRWIISSPVTLNSGTNSFHVDDLWWEPLHSESESDNLDLLAGGDEIPITVPDDHAYGSIPINKLRGGGIYIESNENAGALVIDRITWTRFRSELDDTQVNFQPPWLAGDLDTATGLAPAKIPAVVSPTTVTHLFYGKTKNKRTGFPGTPVAGLTGNVVGHQEDSFLYSGNGTVTYQVYAEQGDYIVALCVGNPTAGTVVQLSARPVDTATVNSFTVTLPKTSDPQNNHICERLILDEVSDGTLHLAEGYNYITIKVTDLAGSFLDLQVVELVKTTAKALVQAEAAEAQSLRSDLTPNYGTYGFMVANMRSSVMPRFGPRVSNREAARDFDIDGFVRDIKTMGGHFVAFRALPRDFAGNVQAVEDLWPGSTPMSWTETNDDLYMALADALNAEGIKFTMLMGRSGFGSGGDNARQWLYAMTKSMNGIGNYYGDKVAGYQQDGGQAEQFSFPRLKTKAIMLAAKTGQVNVQRGNGANWNADVLTDPWQEFTLKEGYGPPSQVMPGPFWTYGNTMWQYGPGTWGQGVGLKSQGGPKITNADNAHSASNTPIASIRNTDADLFPWARDSLQNGGTITFGAEAYQTPYEGSYFSEDQIAQMERLNAYAGLFPDKAVSPLPLDGGVSSASGIVTLSWTGDTNADGHDVYWGTNLNEVATATQWTSHFKGKQSETSFSIDGLTPGQTVYWRVDENIGYATTKGDVWSFTVASAAQPFPVDISTDATVSFDSTGDVLTNTNGISDWGTANLKLSDGSNLSGVDFTALGITSWTAGTFGSSEVTVWDGANLSGLNLTFTEHNFGKNDSMVGTDFSGATIANDAVSGNQPFLFVDAEGADFSGATFHLTPYSGRVNFFRTDGGAGRTIRDADFSDITWGVAVGDSGSLHDLFFNVGPGTTSAADKEHAVTFEGADLSLITGLSKSNMIANLGGFDGGTAIGAKYDQAMLDASGWTAAELDAAGWQFVSVSDPQVSITSDASGNISITGGNFEESATITLEFSPILIDSDWQPVVGPTSGVTEAYWTLSPTNSAGFYRIIKQ